MGQPVSEVADAYLFSYWRAHARHALPKMYVPYAAADIDVRKNCACRWENNFQRLVMTFILRHLQEHAANFESLLAQVHRSDVQTPPAKIQGERTCRPAHASATCAYARDQNHELGAPCLLAQAVGATCARSSVTFIFGVARLGARWTCESARSAACGPAHPVDGSRPRSRAQRTFPND